MASACQSPHSHRDTTIPPRELTQQSLRDTLKRMKLLDQYEAACQVRRLTPRTIQTYRRWVEEFLRFHHDRTGQWIHPQDMGEKEVEAFLTHLAVNRRGDSRPPGLRPAPCSSFSCATMCAPGTSPPPDSSPPPGNPCDQSTDGLLDYFNGLLESPVVTSPADSSGCRQERHPLRPPLN